MAAFDFAPGRFWLPATAFVRSRFSLFHYGFLACQPAFSRSIAYHRGTAWPAGLVGWAIETALLCVPVKAYPAIATPPEIPLRQLHAVCGQRIEYRKCCPTHGEVPAEEIIKGYPYQPDQYVRLTEEELASLQPNDEKTLHLEHFLNPADVDLVLLAGRSLYLAPANPAARRPFASVYQAMERAASGASAGSFSPASGRSSPCVRRTMCSWSTPCITLAQRRALVNPEGRMSRSASRTGARFCARSTLPTERSVGRITTMILSDG